MAAVPPRLQGAWGVPFRCVASTPEARWRAHAWGRRPLLLLLPCLRRVGGRRVGRSHSPVSIFCRCSDGHQQSPCCGWAGGAQTEALSPLRSTPLRSGKPGRPSSTSLSCETFSWCGTEARVPSSVAQRSRSDQRVPVGTGAATGSVMGSAGDLMCAMNQSRFEMTATNSH